MKKALRTLITITILFQSVSGSAQVFFKSKQAFTSDQLSFVLHEDKLVIIGI